MPMYEYRCNSCGTVYEKLRRASDADRELECPDCESKDVRRLISAFATGGPACSPSGGGGGFR
jgi:putative FmdB family regulatory protein